MRFPIELLDREIRRICQEHGVSLSDARTLADVLLEAELEGLSGHGLSRLPVYLSQIQAGGLKARPNLKVRRLATGVLLLDAAQSLGPVAASRAVKELKEPAREAGVAAIAVRNGGHIGALSYYVKRLATDNFVTLAMANTPKAMAPWGGEKPLLGTNPIAFAAPASPEPCVVDLALSVTSRGNILSAARQNKEIPEGWAVDAHGNPTRDPHEALGGGLLPAGGAKGYALAVMVEVLAGVFAGGLLSSELPFPWDQPDRRSFPGFFMLALDASLFPGAPARLEELTKQVESYGGRLPGSRRLRLREDRRSGGIPLSEELCERLRDIGMNLNSTGSGLQSEPD